MAIFPDLKLEKTVQVNEKLRISAIKSFASVDEAAISLVEIDPGDGTFRNVTGSSSSDWFLDWAFSTDAGSPYSVIVRVTTDGAPVTRTESIEVLSVANDNLFSTDQDIVNIEGEILKYLPKDGSKSSFLHVHRRAQKRIMDELDANGNTNRDGTRLTKDQLVEVDDVNQWSAYMTLSMIFYDISNKPDDTYMDKAKKFESMANFYKERSFLRVDLNSDGSIDESEKLPIRSARLVRQ